MILLLAVTSFGILLSLLYGWMLEFAAVKFLKLNEDHDLYFSITILSGLALLSGLLGIWSFYHGIGTRAVVFFLLLALLSLIVTWKYVFVRLEILAQQLKSLSVLSWLFFVASTIFALYIAAASSPTYDTGLYHAQAIRWIENFRVVPGLANLHIRFGFNSNIFLLAAFWGLAGFGWHLYQVSGLIIFLCMILYGLYLAEKLRKGLTFGGIAALGFFIWLLFNGRVISWLASPATDLPAALITWLIFLLAFEKVEAGNKQLDLHLIAIVILCLFDVTIKLSSLPILLIPIYFLWEARASFSLKNAIALVILSSAVFLSWVARNVVLTGYLLFPFAQLDIFRFDWKVPPESVKQITEIITSWARIPYLDFNLVLFMPLGQWLPIWYQALSANDSFLLVGILVGIIPLIILIAVDKETARKVRSYTPVYAVSIVGAVFWFAQSPSPRFGYGFLVPLLLFLYTPFIALLLELVKYSRGWFALIAQSLLTILVLIAVIRIPLKSWEHYMNLVTPYPQVVTRTVNLGSQTLFIPVSGDQCWYDAFPCTPSEISGLAMRESSLQDGFYISQK